ncbi:FecR family protein [Pseudomonas sp. SIMBA_077]
MNSQGPEQQSITQTAAEWAVRLHAGDLDAVAQAQLEEWLAADARHSPALQFAEQTWAAMGALALDPEIAQPTPRRQRVEAPRPALFKRRRRALRWVGRAAVLSLVLAVGWLSGPTVLISMQADYRTGAGEIRTVQLDDGSSVELDASSAIRIDYDTDERRISLLAGSAVFDVAPMGESEVRPFVVQSAGGQTKALGTQFVVGRQSSDQAWVGVLQHSVAVSLKKPPLHGPARKILQEGQSARYSTLNGVEPLPDVDLSAATSWRRGVLVFDRQPLAYVIEQLNRYRSGQIVLANPALAQRQVSGVFRLEMLDNALQTLTQELQVKHVELASVSLIY